jgi:F-type H+-transporting ATPase subunit b
MNINLTLLMQAVAFAAFIWFTAKFVWPPLMRAVETRQRQIAEGLEAGEQGRQNLVSAEKRVADMINEAKAKAGEIVATPRPRHSRNTPRRASSCAIRSPILPSPAPPGS